MRLAVRNNGCTTAPGAQCRSGSDGAGGGRCTPHNPSSSSRYGTWNTEREREREREEGDFVIYFRYNV